ncbi:putative MDH1-malate dehydrogenase precursor, mitochondrial [Linderina pennispora]|uniref:malate dehydrogenase n=1 Tax=Linderina pennispora TaxID=61395 RepID=A0A1Y1W4F5_9FUNG|nr:putative MDH1-malate dehydrogenase precursor, mitochondrial [Linderina pennispora]ORX68357.1 putative MDH1-malate dehydrogenase precursor, mitochondrial [Linderina pennispora]
MVSVAILGAAGGIGQPLSLLLKMNPHVTRLNLYDLVNVPGVAADISHINTNSTVSSHLDKQNLGAALTGVDIVIIPAGVPRKPGMTRDDLFNINAGIVRTLAEAIADYCPTAIVGVISNPVNSTVPIAAEVLKARGVYNPKRLFGVTSLDVVRASRFVRDIRPTVDASALRIPVVGGHSGTTIVPLLSLAEPRFGGDEVVQAKAGAGSATLSMAYAAARFTDSVIRAINGEDVVEPAFVSLDADPHGAENIRALGAGSLEYFAVPVQLGKEGVQRIVPVPSVTPFERKAIGVASAELQKNISKGVSFTQKAKI